MFFSTTPPQLLISKIIFQYFGICLLKEGGVICVFTEIDHLKTLISCNMELKKYDLLPFRCS